MLGESQIRHYYLKGFKEPSTIQNWPSIWRKQFKIRTCEGYFVKLNRYRSKLNFKHLQNSTKDIHLVCTHIL
jgi:hypothetical protein